MRCARVAALSCAVLSSGLPGCGPSTTWTRRGPEVPARAPNCEFEIHRNGSVRAFVVLGVLDVDAFSVRSLPKSDVELRPVVAQGVCRVGGDAVLPGIDGDGRCVLATVIKYLDAPETAGQGGAL